jgi:hypothetical protein
LGSTPSNFHVKWIWLQSMIYTKKYVLQLYITEYVSRSFSTCKNHHQVFQISPSMKFQFVKALVVCWNLIKISLNQNSCRWSACYFNNDSHTGSNNYNIDSSPNINNSDIKWDNNVHSDSNNRNKSNTGRDNHHINTNGYNDNTHNINTNGHNNNIDTISNNRDNASYSVNNYYTCKIKEFYTDLDRNVLFTHYSFDCNESSL